MGRLTHTQKRILHQNLFIGWLILISRMYTQVSTATDYNWDGLKIGLRPAGTP
jgi:hypothetical protein